MHALRRSTLTAVVAVLLVSAALSGCAARPAAGPAGTPAASEPAFPVSVRDDAGREVTMTSEPMRIVSLAPGDTEIVAALGRTDRLVGVTTFDTYPPEVTSVPKVGDFSGPNLEAVAAQSPDLVLATSGVQAEIVTKLEKLGATVVVVDPQSLDELYRSIGVVGKVLGADEEAEALVRRMRLDMASIAEAARAAAGEAAAPSAFIEIAQDPLFTAGKGTLIDDLVTAAGGRNVVSQQGYVAYSLEQLLKDDPAAYLATKGSMSDPKALGKRPGFDKLSAVREGRVAILDDDLVSRPGPRVVDGTLAIAKALHPAWTGTWPVIGE